MHFFALIAACQHNGHSTTLLHVLQSMEWYEACGCAGCDGLLQQHEACPFCGSEGRLKTQLLRVPVDCHVEERVMTFEFRGRKVLRHVFPNGTPHDIELQRGVTIAALKGAFPKGMALDLITWAKPRLS